MQKFNMQPLQAIENVIVEEIKKIRTSIRYLNAVNRVINITSTVGKEGKSMVAFWLAYSLSELDKKVILVDADMRKRILNDKKNPDNSLITNMELNGLTEYLQGNVSKEELACSTNIANFDVIVSGKDASNPTELLSGFRLKDLMKYLKDNYDYIIVDSPALSEVADAAIIAEHCDSNILVLEPGVTPYKLAQKAKEQLENSGTKLLGVVLNKA